MNSGTIERYLVLFICLVLLGSNVFFITASADEPVTVRFGVYQNPPLVFTTEEGYTSGIFIDLLEHIADKESWTIKYVPGDWADLLEQLERGEVDMIGAIAHTEARSALFDFSTESVITNWGQIYTKADAEIESILDLEGKTLAILKADIHAKAFKNLLQSFDVSAHLIEVEDYQSVFGALQKGEADAGVINRLAAMKYLGDYDVRETSIIFNPVGNCYAVTKDVHQDLVAALDANLRALKADDSSIYYQSLEKCFGVSYAEKPVIPRWVYYVLVSIGGLALLLLGGNYLLRNRVSVKTKELREEITERRRAEELFKKLFYNSPNAIFIIQDGRYVLINPQFVKETGYSEKETIKFGPFKLIYPKDRKMVREKTIKMLKGELLSGFEYRGINKNGDIRWLLEVVTSITYKGRRAILGNFKDITEIRQIQKELQQSYEKLQKTMKDAINTIGKIAESRDPYTAGHQLKVSELATVIAREMKLPPDKIEGIRVAGLVHDIGKNGLPAEILSKPTRLTDIEFSLIKGHSQIGHDILKSIDFSYPIANIVLQHHERLDGSGYPNKLKGDEIMLEAKIIGVADVVEAMSSHRPYRPAKGVDKALEEITKNRGILYDPKVVDACLKLFKEKGFKFKSQ